MPVYLLTPAVYARMHIANDRWHDTLLRRVVLDQFDRLLTGRSTAYLERNPDVRDYVLGVLRHFKAASALKKA